MPKRKERVALPAVGTKLTRKYHDKVIDAEVCEVDGHSGRVSLRIGSTVYPSLSAAAKAITGQESNGWKFWKLD